MEVKTTHHTIPLKTSYEAAADRAESSLPTDPIELAIVKWREKNPQCHAMPKEMVRERVVFEMQVKAAEELLLPCPFCGSAGEIGYGQYSPKEKDLWVQCANQYCRITVGWNCGCDSSDSGDFDTFAEAVAAWNTRFSPPSSENLSA